MLSLYSTNQDKCEHIYCIHYIPLQKLKFMSATISNKKRKNIDLPTDTLQKLSIMAAAQN